jgi:hypothetical protein
MISVLNSGVTPYRTEPLPLGAVRDGPRSMRRLRALPRELLPA